jgi:hypothetical protein
MLALLFLHPKHRQIIAIIVILIMMAYSRPKSFPDIVRNHRDFLVNPLQWTSRHLDLVGCRFEDIATTPIYAESTKSDGRNSDSQKSYPELPSDAELIAMNMFPIIKRHHLINILVVHTLGKSLESDGTTDKSIGMTDNLTWQQRNSLFFSRSAGSSTKLYRVSSSRRFLRSRP